MDHCGPSLRNRSLFLILPPEDQCTTLPSGECLYHPATLSPWTIMDLVREINGECIYHLATLPTLTIMDQVIGIDMSSESHPLRASV